MSGQLKEDSGQLKEDSGQLKEDSGQLTIERGFQARLPITTFVRIPDCCSHFFGIIILV